jgi:hypothetical protein
MRTPFLLALLLFCLPALAQDSLDTKFANSFCGCMGTKKALSEKDMLTCVQTAMMENKDLVQSAAVASGATTYEDGRKFGKALWERIAPQMIFTCDVYFTFFDTLRNGTLHTDAPDSIRNRINSIGAEPSDEQRLERGMLYFRLNNVSAALADFDAVTKSRSLGLGASYFKAWALEKLGRYDEAIVLYDNLAEKTGRTEMKIMSALAQRKKSGK